MVQKELRPLLGAVSFACVGNLISQVTFEESALNCWQFCERGREGCKREGRKEERERRRKGFGSKTEMEQKPRVCGIPWSKHLSHPTKKANMMFNLACLQKPQVLRVL